MPFLADCENSGCAIVIREGNVTIWIEETCLKEFAALEMTAYDDPDLRDPQVSCYTSLAKKILVKEISDSKRGVQVKIRTGR